MGTLTQAESVFKTLVWDPLFVAGNTALAAAFPALKLPVISQVEGFVENELRDYIYSLICLYINVEAIVLMNSAHQAAYEAASIQLKAVASGSGPDSQAYQKALTDAEADLSNFARFYV